MDVERPVLAGFLNVPAQSGFSLNRISKKKPCHRYCLLFKSSRHGIERLEICESKEDKSPKIITLENCVKITHEFAPANLIQIVKKSGTLTLNPLTEDDLKEWVTALQTVAFRDRSIGHGSQTAIEEDNDLYCTSFGDGLFIITLIPSDTSKRCNFEAKPYILHLTATELQLKSTEELNIVIAKWPYRFIRKYGYRDGKFTFEAGRKCSTGEGVFILDHTNPQAIFRCMSAKMKSMKKLMSGDSLSSIECGENLLSVAASMEAGSRSPLPPSHSNQLNSDFEINSPQSSMSKGFISSSDSLNNFSITLSANNSSSGKNIPSKPPRKLPTPLDRISSTPITPAHSSCGTQLNSEKFKKYQTYEPVSITTSKDSNKNGGSTVILKPASPEAIRRTNTSGLPARNDMVKSPTERDYESIETITDAWKTRGVNDVKHTERNATVSKHDDPIEFVRQHSLLQREKSLPKIVDIDIGEGGNCSNSLSSDATYDRLDFLSPNNKTSSGYKTIVAVTAPGSRARCSPPLPNDYEMIASPDTQSCRRADDSHLGYGILRKPSASTPGTKTSPAFSSNNNATLPLADLQAAGATRPPLQPNESPLDHRNYNGLSYTIVSKPKRV